jgi:D-tyrosyl-tRNA(Tyr) deacylase
VIGLLQRVSAARVDVDGETIGAIGCGLLVFVGIQKGDDEAKARRLIERVLGYRVFPDAAGRMNRSLHDLQGGLLLVPQFTLAADTKKGSRASFTSAAPPEVGLRLYEYLLALARDIHPVVESGRFGADMKVSLLNDGPVTFWLQS